MQRKRKETKHQEVRYTIQEHIQTRGGIEHLRTPHTLRTGNLRDFPQLYRLDDEYFSHTANSVQRREVKAFHLEILLPNSPHHQHSKPPPHWTRSTYTTETTNAHKRCDLTFPTEKACHACKMQGKSRPLDQTYGPTHLSKPQSQHNHE